MTRFPYDQFSKNYLEELLQPLGTVQIAREVAGEVREIDVWFSPNESVDTVEVSRLGLRILGKGRVQNAAIDELEALPEDEPLRTRALELLYSLKTTLEVSQNIDEEDRELIMRLSPLYTQKLEEATRRGQIEGEKQGQKKLVENLLKIRFGSLDEQLSAIIEPLLSLPTEEFTPLLLQLSRDELIERFG